MSRPSEARAWALATAGVLCLSAITYKVMMTPDLRPIAQGATTALNTINRPCKGTSCGTLASVDKLVVKVGDIAVDTQTQVRQSGKLIDTASQSLRSVAESAQGAIGTLNGALTHVAPLLDSLKASSDALNRPCGVLSLYDGPAADEGYHIITAPSDEGYHIITAPSDEGPGRWVQIGSSVTSCGTLANLDNLLSTGSGDLNTITTNANGAVTDFRRFITAPALTETLNNVASTTGSAAGIAGDARKLADHYTEQDLKPVPWWKKPFAKGGEIIDIGAAVARHLP